MKDTNILESYSLLAFAKSHGRMKVAPFSVKDTDGTTHNFKSCVFDNGEDLTFVQFSRKLGELTPSQISEQKDGLQVCKVKAEKAKAGYCFVLCKYNSTWEDVDL